MSDTRKHDNEDGRKSIGIDLEGQYIDFIRDRLGIVIKPNNPDFTKTILNACKKFHCTPVEYLYTLKKGLSDTPEIEYLISGITIGETYFFRDKNQMRILAEVVLPDIIKTKRELDNLTIRVWSAGCSSGEEIYTIAMMLEEMLPDIDKWKIILLGTDVNVAILKKAMAAKYSEWSMRSITDYYKRKYFTQADNAYYLDERISKHVMFEYLNLTDDVYPSLINNTSAQDLILCRNVLIYFDNAHIDMLMKKIAKCLVPGGYLLLGSSDPIQLENTGLSRCAESPSLCRHTDKVVSGDHAAIFKPPAALNDTYYSPPQLLPAAHPVASAAVKGEFIRKHKAEEVHTQLAAKITDKVSDINKLIAAAKWHEVIQYIETLDAGAQNHALILTSKAAAYANLGQANDAIYFCEKSLALDQTNAWTYYMLALAYSEKNNVSKAEASFRKAIFLDHNFAICYFQFGLFMIRHHHTEDGYKLLNNALKITRKCLPDATVPYANDLSYKRLGDILEHEIELYKGVANHE